MALLLNKCEQSVFRSGSTLKFKKLSYRACSPLRATPRSAGLDLYAAYSYVVHPGSCKAVRTDIAIELPINTYGQILTRSGLALKESISVFGGVIDEDYRGNIKIIVFNHSKKTFRVKRGDKLAQLVVIPILFPELKEEHTLSKTFRESLGFGSSGK